MSLSCPLQVLVLGLIPLFWSLFHLIRHLSSHTFNLFESQIKIWFPNTLTSPCLELLSTGELKTKTKQERASKTKSKDKDPKPKRSHYPLYKLIKVFHLYLSYFSKSLQGLNYQGICISLTKQG